ncbi:hypothetical protein RMATCC62417_10478 [Rhizopus microsporus]|nr:hypothetical protein RMATCC62417_10478 [Rhizopus microsporus]
MDVPVAEQILNTSLTTLRLTAKHLSSEILSAYSCALPELRKLTIETSYWFGGPSSLVVDMTKIKFNHLKIHVNILSKKSGQKQVLTNTTLSNQVEEIAMATNKEHGYIAIKCAPVDFISISFNKIHVHE